SSFMNLTGATASSFTSPAATAAMNGYKYQVIVTNSAGSVTSNAATLTVVTQSVSAPTTTVGSVSGAAGTTVSIPINFDPGTASVAGMQFNLTLPAGLSSGTVTAGTILNTAGKTVSTAQSGNTWTFLIFGLNQNAIAAGNLLTAQISIAPGTPAG